MRAFGSPGAAASDPGPASASDGARLIRHPAVLWGVNEDTRLLLRGLLQLYRCPSVHEVSNLDELEALPSLSAPTVLVFDAESPEWESDLASALSARPELRGLVILPRDATTLESRARAAGASEIIYRPFAVHDFALAVAATGDARPSPADASDF